MLPTMTTTQQFTLTLNPTDRKGKPAPVDPNTPVTWASSNEAVATVVPVDGTLGALDVAQGVGDYTVSASADADLGSGVTTITGQDSGTVSQGTAISVGMTAGQVEEQP